MPPQPMELCRFNDITISMSHAPGLPAHFHADYDGNKATYSVEGLVVTGGSLAKTAHELVIEWANLYQAELREAWATCGLGQAPDQIGPLPDEMDEYDTGWGEEDITVAEVEPRDGYRIWLRYTNGASGEVDLSHLAGSGVFKAWYDRDFFERIYISESGAVSWEGDIDLDPYQLYMDITGKTLEGIFPRLRARTPGG